MADEHKRIDFLLERLKSDDWSVREDAAELLGEVGEPNAVEPLIEALQDEDWHVREAAALSLAILRMNGALCRL